MTTVGRDRSTNERALTADYIYVNIILTAISSRWQRNVCVLRVLYREQAKLATAG